MSCMIDIQKIKNDNQFKINLHNEFDNLEKEKGLLFFFDDNLKFKHVKSFSYLITKSTHDSNYINLFELRELIDNSPEKNIIYIHNHPSNLLFFSVEDIGNYTVLKHFEKKLGYKLLDAIVINKVGNKMIFMEEEHNIDVSLYPLEVYIREYYKNNNTIRVHVSAENYTGLEFSKFILEYGNENNKGKEHIKKSILEVYGDMIANITFEDFEGGTEIWKKV